MKKILCYGDSNTWGQAEFNGRIADEKQWPNILQAELSDYKVIQEGLGGRIAGDYDSNQPYRNGKTAYEVAFRSANPIDIVVIALGTNDLKPRYNRTAEQIVDDLLWYAQESNRLNDKLDRPHPRMIYLLPANFVSGDYYNGSEELRQKVIALMKQKPYEHIELNNLRMTKDGVHYSYEAHEQVAQLVKEKIMEK